jgi:hypothetical protein
MKKRAIRFDATDLSLAYASILKARYNNNRKLAEKDSFAKLVEWLHLKNYHEEKLQFILKNWCVLLFGNEPTPGYSTSLKNELIRLFETKATGPEENYIAGLQQTGELRKILERILRVRVANK